MKTETIDRIVCSPVWGSVWDSVYNSVYDSVRDSVWFSVGDWVKERNKEV